MKYLLLSIFLCTLLACKPGSAIKYHYTIRDFPDSLRTDLRKIVNYGFIGSPSYESAGNIRMRISDNDCKRLALSEHPILRSLALDILCNRHHLDHYSIMMHHLDDTAYVNWYYQCASFTFITVSDFMVKEYKWYTEEEKKRTVEKIIRDHNYLQSAYEALHKTTLTEAHYPFVRKMAEKEALMKFRSEALLHLAGYKKITDTGFLHKALYRSRHELDANAFGIMELYQDPFYFDMLKRYFPVGYYRNFCKKDPERNNTETALSYVNALAAYRSNESAVILEKILFQEPLVPCFPADTFGLRQHLYEVIEKNTCGYYSKMLHVVKPWLERERKESAENSFPLDTTNFYQFPPNNTNPPKIRW